MLRHFLRRRTTVLLLVGIVTAVSACSSVSLDEPIEGRTWRLANLAQQPVLPGADPQRDPQVVFDAGRVSGSGGCNRLNGSYSREGSRLLIGSLMATRMACADGQRGALEARFVAALQSTAGYRLHGSEMDLVDAGGQTLATFSSAPLR